MNMGIKRNIKGTKTEENLKEAMKGEALAHLKYQFYRSQISDTCKEYEQILDEIVHNEKEHGKIWFKLLQDGVISSNIDNLIDAIAGEMYECSGMYIEFSEVAREEGFEDIAELFEKVAKIECSHADKFNELKKNIIDRKLFTSSKETCWKCLNCGHMIMSENAPECCPVCNHPQKYFKRWYE